MKRSKAQKEGEQAPKKRVIRRRKDDPNDPDKEKSRRLRMYFTSDTQAAIVRFQQETESTVKNEIYLREIMPALDKLVENLINVYKFTGLYESFDELKADVVSFLYETLGKFDATRGTPAFAYFNVVAKNALIIKTKERTTKARRNIYLDDQEHISAHDTGLIENHNTISSNAASDLERDTLSKNVLEMFYEIREDVTTENELACINSIITIFENVDHLDIVNKQGTFLYIRELSGLSPKQLAAAMASIRKSYLELKGDDCFDLF
jgi:hypothetical protein